jgi:hypothetical protein
VTTQRVGELMNTPFHRGQDVPKPVSQCDGNGDKAVGGAAGADKQMPVKAAGSFPPFSAFSQRDQLGGRGRGISSAAGNEIGRIL